MTRKDGSLKFLRILLILVEWGNINKGFVLSIRIGFIITKLNFAITFQGHRKSVNVNQTFQTYSKHYKHIFVPVGFNFDIQLYS